MRPYVIGGAVVVLASLLGGCGDDGGSADPALVELLRDEGGQSGPMARCIAEAVGDDEDVDRDELEAIIRGRGSTDVGTADAYGDAARACAEEELRDRNIPGAP